MALRSVLATLWAVVLLGAAASAADAPAVVFVGTVKPTELFETLTYPARVIPEFNSTILAEADGIVSRIYAPLGRRVARGQKILSISHTDPVYQYAPVIMLSPVDGVVSLVEIAEGSQVTKGQRLASVTDPTRVRIAVEVPAEDLGLLSRGQAGEFLFSGSDRKIQVKVHGISPFVDPATGTASCELELAARGAPVAPGMLGSVSFKANAHSGISIPDYAVIYRGADTMVRVVDTGGKARQVPVKLGRRQRGNVEILGGLQAGSKLVLRSSRYVADSETVTVQESR